MATNLTIKEAAAILIATGTVMMQHNVCAATARSNMFDGDLGRILAQNGVDWARIPMLLEIETGEIAEFDPAVGLEEEKEEDEEEDDEAEFVELGDFEDFSWMPGVANDPAAYKAMSIYLMHEHRPLADKAAALRIYATKVLGAPEVANMRDDEVIEAYLHNTSPFTEAAGMPNTQTFDPTDL